jgi:hypothetical protein
MSLRIRDLFADQGIVFRKEQFMGMLPVPEAMMDMYKRIGEIARNVEAQQGRWDKVIAEVSGLKTSVNALGALGTKLDVLNDTLTATKNELQTLSSKLERML